MAEQDHVFTDLPNSIVSETAQICIVTRDLGKTVREYSDRMGIGPWWIQTYEAPMLAETKLRGEPTDFSMRLALAWTGRLNWEVIEPLKGPSIYHEFLEQHGEGLHHVGVLLTALGMDWPTCDRTFKERGMSRLMEGRWGEVRFCYYDTEGPLHTTFEIIDRPQGWQRPEPEEWYPAKR